MDPRTAERKRRPTRRPPASTAPRRPSKNKARRPREIERARFTNRRGKTGNDSATKTDRPTETEERELARRIEEAELELVATTVQSGSAVFRLAAMAPEHAERSVRQLERKLQALRKLERNSASRQAELAAQAAMESEQGLERCYGAAIELDQLEQQLAHAIRTVREQLDSLRPALRHGTRLLCEATEIGRRRLRAVMHDTGLPAASLRRTCQAVRTAEQQVSQAKDALVQRSLWIVVELVRRYRNRGLELSDLLQEGSIGLLRAVDKFEYRRGYRFSTYANWWVRQAMGRAIANQAHTIRVPIHMRNKIRGLNQTMRTFLQRHGREPQVEELAVASGLDVDTVALWLAAAQTQISLDAPVGQDQNAPPLGALIADAGKPDPEADTVETQLRAELREALERLSPREEQILRWRFGFDEKAPQSLEEIGRRFNVTRERIRQIELKALSKLRTAPNGERLRAFTDS